jgi:hypothetical protein
MKTCTVWVFVVETVAININEEECGRIFLLIHNTQIILKARKMTVFVTEYVSRRTNSYDEMEIQLRG